MPLWLLGTTIIKAQTINMYTENQLKMDNKTILLTANKAVEEGNYAGFLSYCTNDAEWNFLGDRTIHGKDAILKYMEKTYVEPPIFNIDTIIEDGDFVTVTGEIKLKNENGTYDQYYYCDNWQFKNGKMAILKAYVVEKNMTSRIIRPNLALADIYI